MGINTDLGWIPHAIMSATDSNKPFQEVGPITRKFMDGEAITTNTRTFLYRKNTYRTELAGIGGMNTQPPVGRAHQEDQIAGQVVDFLVQIPINLQDLFFVTGDDIGQANAEQRLEKYIATVTGQVYRSMEWFSSRVLQEDNFAIDPSVAAFPQNFVNMSNTFGVFGGLQEFTVGTSWSDATAKIVSGADQLQGAKDLMEDKGFEAGDLIFNKNTSLQIAANDEIREYVVNNGGVTLDWLNNRGAANIVGLPAFGSVPDYTGTLIESGIAQIPNWRSWNHYYRDRTNTLNRFIQDDRALLFPRQDQLASVMGWVNAPSLIPTGSEYGEQIQDAVELRNGLTVYLARNGGARPSYSLVALCAGYPVLKNNDGFVSIKTVAP